MTLDTASPFAALRTQRDRFVGFAFAAADLLLEVTSDGRIAFAVGAAQHLHGCAAEALIGRPVFELLQPADRAIAASLLASLTRGERFHPVMLRLASADKPPIVFGGCRLGNRPDAFFLTLAISASVPPPVASGEGILTREAFAERAAQYLLEAGQEDCKLTLLTLDELDALTARLSAEISDGLVGTIERYIYSCASGIAAAGCFGNGRYGVIHRCELDAERLQSGIEGFARAIDPAGKGVSLRAATMALDEDGLDAADTVRALVYCINQFAEAGKGEMSIPTLRDALDGAMAATMARVGNLRATVAERDFTLVYQPIVDLATRAIHHVEALARFADGDSPGDTVAFAEAVRLIADFDLAVCEQVTALLRQRKEATLPIAVNVSGRSLEGSVFTEALLALLQPELAPRLLLEITESAVITETEAVNARLQAVRRAGFKVCLDDFGAGANSFHYLRSFEVDFIKIDGAFVRAALAHSRDGTLLSAISGFCREIGVATIGEMIESEAGAEGLRRLGVDYAQGYHFGRPVAALDEIPPPAAPARQRVVVRRRAGQTGYVASWE